MINSEMYNMVANDTVDITTLATNFTDVIPDCCGTDVDPIRELQERHPVFNFLINSALASRVRQQIDGQNGNCFLQKDTNGEYVLKIPGTFWTLEPESSAEECCWAPFDFAKCAGEVPVKRLCLKDCDTIDNELLGRFLRVRSDYGGVARSGETYWDTKKRIARLSMAFLTQYNVMYGQTNSTTNVLKPFHGLFEVMSNPAVIAISGYNVLAAFEELACRLSFLGGLDGFVIAVNPIIYQSLDSVIQPSIYGLLPNGWSRNGNELSFRGIRFMRDSFIPVDLTNMTGEAWVLAGDSVGAWMATDLLPADAFIKESGHQEESLADGCGSSCTFYYNFGTVFNNNANRIARIVDIPITAACASTAAMYPGVVNPTTLIPRY